MTTLIFAGLLLSPHVDPTPPMPLFVNPYDWRLGGINCMEPCNRFGNGELIQDFHYGIRMACNPAHIGCQFRIWNEFGEIGPIWCVESGDALLQPQLYNGQLVQYVDILHHLVDDDGQRIPDNQLPWWNQGLFTEYEVDCNWHE